MRHTHTTHRRTGAHFQGRYFSAQDAAITFELRTAQRHSHVDLDAFLDLTQEERAARWRQWDRAAKWQAVALMLERVQGDWDAEAVESWIERYNKRWGA
jgi:hypothetical protein